MKTNKRIIHCYAQLNDEAKNNACKQLQTVGKNRTFCPIYTQWLMNRTNFSDFFIQDWCAKNNIVFYGDGKMIL